MSEEQRADNLGIDWNLRNTDPLEYSRQLSETLKRLQAGLRQSAVEPNWVFVVVEGPELGQMIHLGKLPVSIGCGQEDTFQLHDPEVTPRQLLVQWDPKRQTHWLSQRGDLRTLINGVPQGLNAGIPHELAAGDQVALGRTVLRYQQERI